LIKNSGGFWGNMPGPMSQRGQAMAAYRLLIGAILAALILTIIVSAIIYLDQFKVDISNQRFYKGLASATEQPNGKTLAISGLTFGETSFSSKALSRQMGMAEECVSLSAKNSPFFNNPDERVVEIMQRLSTTVYARCSVSDLGYCDPDCEICCEVKFGESFE